jgi:hypothetical protein
VAIAVLAAQEIIRFEMPQVFYYKFKVPGCNEWFPLKATLLEDVVSKAKQVDKNAFNLRQISYKEFKKICQQNAS